MALSTFKVPTPTRTNYAFCIRGYFFVVFKNSHKRWELASCHDFMVSTDTMFVNNITGLTYATKKEALTAFETHMKGKPDNIYHF